MFRLLFKYLMPLVMMLVCGIVGYNYFHGTPAEQQQSREIIATVRGLGSDVVDLLYSEKEKFDAGKYDNALDKISSAINSLKNSVGGDANQPAMDQIRDLEQQQQLLQRSVGDMNQANAEAGIAARSPNESNGFLSGTAELEARIKQLAEQTEQLGNRLGQPFGSARP